MLPKIIHYCWFGHAPLPDDALRCINSWRKFQPDWQIWLWNEANFDVDQCQYTAEAYRQGKFAFVSDYARFWALHRFGGVYLDTDVELIKSIDVLAERGPFMGFEKSLATNGTDASAVLGVNSGLGMGAMPDMPFLRAILAHYDGLRFNMAEGTVVRHITEMLTEKGLINADVEQRVEGFVIYPSEVLCPMDSTTGIVEITPKTVSIHHYACSWIDHSTWGFRMHILKFRLIKLFGPRAILTISRLFRR